MSDKDLCGICDRTNIVAPTVSWTRCSVHRKAIASKCSLEELKPVPGQTLKLVKLGSTCESMNFRSTSAGNGRYTELFVDSHLSYLASCCKNPCMSVLEDEACVLPTHPSHKPTLQG
jgi:hypothetical protein